MIVNKWLYLIAIIVTMILGLGTREFNTFFPAFIAVHGGDFLWAMMVYWGFRFLFVRRSIHIAFLLSIIFSFSIEFSQLYQANWINQIRASIIGALILGKGFLLLDLIRYSCGIISSAVLDKVWISFRRKKEKMLIK